MSPRDVVERWVERFNAGEADGLAALYHEDAVNHQVAEQPVEGRLAIREMFRREFAAAEMTCIPEVIHEAGDVAILEWRDPLGLRGCGFFTVTEGRIPSSAGTGTSSRSCDCTACRSRPSERSAEGDLTCGAARWCRMARVEVPSRVHGPEAYVPPEPDVDGEDDWPPASRELAIEQARQERLEEGGLPIDDATLERVADAVMDPEYPLPGGYYTAEELADMDDVDEDDGVPFGAVYVMADEPAAEAAVDQGGHGPFGAVDEYLREHPEINGGTRLGWRDGRRTLFVGLVSDAEAHKGPLLRMGNERVAFEPVSRTVRELEELAERIVDDRTALQAAGFELLRSESDRPLGVVHVAVVGGRDAASAREYLAGRYGDAVAVEWLGPSRYREVPHPFGSWTSDGRLIRVFFGLDRNGQQRGEARVAEETGEKIVIALTRLQPVGATIGTGGFQPHHADLQLREPVGNRAVIDASEGVIRPSLAQLRGTKA